MRHFICAPVVVLLLCPQETEDRLTQLGSKDAVVRLEAVRALEESGSQSAPVVERLVELLGDADGDVAYRARKALIAIGEPVHARLVGALANDLLRVSAAIALRYQDEPGRMALERYLESDASQEARLEVLSVLGTPGFDRILDLVDGHPAYALRALRRLRTRGRFFRRPTDLADRIAARVADQELRVACELVLTASADPLPTDTFDRVIKWLEERESALQETAAWALGVTHLARVTALWQTKEALPGLEALLAADDSMVRRTAAWAIGGILTRVRIQRGDLIALGQRMFHDVAIPVPGMGTDFHYAWRRLIVGGKPLIPLLSEVTTWKWFCTLSSDDMRQMFQPRPRQWHGMYTEVVPILSALLGDPEEGVVRAAAWSLGGAGPEGAPATAKLTELLASSNRRVRIAAAMALADIGPAARAAKAAAVQSLWDGGGGLEVYFLATLGQSSVAELARALEHPEPVAVEFAIMALAQLDTDSVDCSEQLAAAFRREHYFAATLLTRMAYGEGVLAEVLAGEYPIDLRGVAAFGLRSYRSPSAETLTALQSAADEGSLLGEVATETLTILDP